MMFNTYVNSFSQQVQKKYNWLVLEAREGYYVNVIIH